MEATDVRVDEVAQGAGGGECAGQSGVSRGSQADRHQLRRVRGNRALCLHGFARLLLR